MPLGGDRFVFRELVLKEMFLRYGRGFPRTPEGKNLLHHILGDGDIEGMGSIITKIVLAVAPYDDEDFVPWLQQYEMFARLNSDSVYLLASINLSALESTDAATSADGLVRSLKLQHR